MISADIISAGGFNGGSPSTLYVAQAAYASLPAGTVTRQKAIATDVGPNGSEMSWNGARWIPVNGRCTLAYLPLPVGIAPTFPANASGTANGAITFGTAVNAAYAKCYVYYPVNSVNASQPAGFYYTEMSTTTAAIVYNNVYTPAAGTLPTEPTSKTAFAGAVPGGAGVTSSVNFLKVTLPAGILGNFGAVGADLLSEVNNTAGGKNTTALLNAAAIHTTYQSGNLSLHAIGQFRNAGSAASQRTHGTWANTNGSNSFSACAVDTSVACTLNYEMTHSTATDLIFATGLIIDLQVSV